jgi:hypothetical protein
MNVLDPKTPNLQGTQNISKFFSTQFFTALLTKQILISSTELNLKISNQKIWPQEN